MPPLPTLTPRMESVESQSNNSLIDIHIARGEMQIKLKSPPSMNISCEEKSSPMICCLVHFSFGFSWFCLLKVNDSQTTTILILCDSG